MNEVEDMDFHILHALVSISIEISRHLGLLHIMCYLVEVPLEPLFQTVLGLAYILFSASRAGYAVHQIVAIAADVVSCSILPTADECYDVAISVKFRAVSAARIVTLRGCSRDLSHGVTA